MNTKFIDAYTAGFMKKCAVMGVNPEALVKLSAGSRGRVIRFHQSNPRARRIVPNAGMIKKIKPDTPKLGPSKFTPRRYPRAGEKYTPIAMNKLRMAAPNDPGAASIVRRNLLPAGPGYTAGRFARNALFGIPDLLKSRYAGLNPMVQGFVGQ